MTSDKQDERTPPPFATGGVIHSRTSEYGDGIPFKFDFHDLAHPSYCGGVSSDGVNVEEHFKERVGVLDDAKEAIVGSRNARYGRPSANFKMIAELWTAMGMSIHGDDLKPHHVAMAMELLKISRQAWSPGHKDNWVDTAGYAACGYEAYMESPDGADR